MGADELPRFGVVFVFGTPVLAVDGGLESVVCGVGCEPAEPSRRHFGFDTADG